jgi:predicted thioesterase
MEIQTNESFIARHLFSVQGFIHKLVSVIKSFIKLHIWHGIIEAIELKGEKHLENGLKAGIKGSLIMIVTENDTAAALGSGNISVFSTPSMIALMEKTSRLSVQGLLDNTKTTVGTKVAISHLKASPVGSEVMCESILTVVDGRRLEFTVAAWVDGEKIGEGTHERFIVDEAKFLSAVYKK